MCFRYKRRLHYISIYVDVYRLLLGAQTTVSSLVLVPSVENPHTTIAVTPAPELAKATQEKCEHGHHQRSSAVEPVSKMKVCNVVRHLGDGPSHVLVTFGLSEVPSTNTPYHSFSCVSLLQKIAQYHHSRPSPIPFEGSRSHSKPMKHIPRHSGTERMLVFCVDHVQDAAPAPVRLRGSESHTHE
jgi:hypothetical protein